MAAMCSPERCSRMAAACAGSMWSSRPAARSGARPLRKAAAVSASRRVSTAAASAGGFSQNWRLRSASLIMIGRNLGARRRFAQKQRGGHVTAAEWRLQHHAHAVDVADASLQRPAANVIADLVHLADEEGGEDVGDQLARA